jgi:hypothetical protein
MDFFRGLASFDPKKGILRVWLLQYAYHRALNRRRHLAASRFYKWVDVANAAAEPVQTIICQLLPDSLRRERLLQRVQRFSAMNRGCEQHGIGPSASAPMNSQTHDHISGIPGMSCS